MISRLLQAIGLKPKEGRSPQWEKVRNDFIKGRVCEACGKDHQLNAHHVVPFHVDRNKELDPTNLIALGEGGTINCHLWLGHCGDWKTWNAQVRADAAHFRAMIAHKEEAHV